MDNPEQPGKDAPRWPLTRVRIVILLALDNQPLSIRGIQRLTGCDRGTIRKELSVLGELGWITEVTSCNGPHRVHKLTPDAKKLSQRLLEIADLFEQGGV